MPRKVNSFSQYDKPSRVFYRPRKYDLEKAFCSEGALVIDQMIKKQANNRYFNRNANHLAFRRSLIKYIKQLIEKLDYSLSTFHLACAILDTVFSLYAINETQIKMLTVISVILAAKMHEPLENIPELSVVSQQFTGDFSFDDLINCEGMVFKILDYNLNIITPYTFATQFIFRGIVSSDDFSKDISPLELNFVLNKIEELVLLFIDISIQSYDYYEYTSISIAASAILCARKAIGLQKVWNEDLHSLCKISFDNIKETSKALYEQAIAVYPKLNELGYKSKKWQEKTPNSKSNPKEYETRSSMLGTDMSNRNLNRELQGGNKIQEFKFENDAGKENRRDG